MYDESGSKLFSSVIVVTDRTVLDSQLQDTIYQFEHAQGVVRPINRDIGNQSKSEQLAEALSEQTRIIIVTIQTFPALFDALAKHPKLASGRYAVIADEAHSSQTGSSANKLKAILGGELPEGEEVSAEELLGAAVAARKPSEKISYYAFTATPKAKTLELFGREPDPTIPRSESNKPEPFHLYSMRQAIEEGFILDVLRRYTTYSVAWKLAHGAADDEVDSRKARTTLAKWVRLHPYNISQKVEIIVEHFRKNVRHLLDGQAKAMVVTSSRQEAARYQLAMQQYIKQNNYRDVHPMVAFSGSLPPDDVIPEEVTETSTLLNPGLNGRDHAKAFDTDEYNVMLVANKYQTGFDQPKLCAMYVDKKLKGVECVQTLSRLNRLFEGKQTFILDFVNETQDILDSFLPYYNKAELTGVSDAQVVYDLQDALDREQIYHWDEVEKFASAFFDPKADSSKLSYYCQPAQERFNKRYQALLDARSSARHAKKQAEGNGDTVGVKHAASELEQIGESLDTLDLFKKNLGSFVRAYEFLSQVVFFDDPELEQLCVFAKNLIGMLKSVVQDDDVIDTSDIELERYRVTKQKEHELRLAEDGGEYGLDPITGVGSGKAHDPEKQRLSEVIDALNEIFGADTSDEDQLHFAKGIAERVSRDEDVMSQVNNHSAEQVMHGLFPKRLTDLVLDSMADHEKFSMDILESDSKQKSFAMLILKLLSDKNQASMLNI